MTNVSKKTLLHVTVAGVLLAVMSQAVAQQPAYPTKPIRLIASQSPGGGIDTVARIVAIRLTDALGQNVMVDNRAGANGSVAGELTAKSPPDGYTMMLGAVGNLAVNGFFTKNMTYDPLRDLAPVTPAVTSGNVLVVHPSVPVKSLKEFLALARARPGELAYGSSGVGGSGHLATGLLQSMAKIKLLHVPYKGNGPAIANLMSGEVQVAFASPASVVTNINSGRLRALAVGTAARSKQFPQVPTISEAGVPGYESKSWYGFVVAAKTPQPIVMRLNKEIAQVLSRPDVIELMLTQGEAWTTSPEVFAAFIKTEHDKWGRVIREQGITAN
ncbi:MAG: Bug family tripartite tricarboxylate transporter substrate binding protein [Betaproteobacteria bacterium]